MTGKYWDRAWSLVDGCTPCSPGCEHCWSMAMAKRFKKWPDRVTVRPDRLDIPLKTRKPTVFAVWNDLFHEDVRTSFIAAAFNEICRAHLRDHTFLILTKRAERMKNTMIDFFEKIDFATVFYRCWLIATVCNQQEADEKIPLLLQTPAAHRGISIEPMLGPIDIQKWFGPQTEGQWMNVVECGFPANSYGIHTVILGGETGPGARPIHPDWVRSVRDQCKAAGVPFFFKQWGKHLPSYGDIYGDWNAPPMHVLVGDKSRLLDGCEHNDLPWRTKDA
jgi:protein gp37